MNTFSIVFLLVLALATLMRLWLGWRHIGHIQAHRTAVPGGFADRIGLDAHQRAADYTCAKTRLNAIAVVFDAAVLLIFTFGGGLQAVDHIAASFFDGDIARGITFVALLMIIMSVIELPFDLYRTFVIEQRFGFNKMTIAMFFGDLAKHAAIGAVLVLPLLFAVLWLMGKMGSMWWLYVWLVAVGFMIFVQFIAPTVIAPLFNKFTPMAPGDLKEAILSYARSVNFPIKNVSVMDGSRRSSKSNAFFTGFGRNKRIALFDTLIAQHTVPEMVAVLAHEVGHYKKKHILQGTIVSILHTGVIFFLLSLFLDSPGLYQAFYMGQESIYAGMLFFAFLYTPIGLLLSIVMQMVSRKNEYEADRFAAETIDEPRNLINALRKLSATNLSNLTPHPFYVLLNYSHPPLIQRIQAIQGTKRENGVALG